MMVCTVIGAANCGRSDTMDKKAKTPKKPKSTKPKGAKSA
jgi:hypothetical protein